jgi:hypothetical protein
VTVALSTAEAAQRVHGLPAAPGSHGFQLVVWTDQVDAASKVDPSNQADLQKAMFAVQQIQNQMSELVTTATNMLKTQHDTDMSEVRNYA